MRGSDTFDELDLRVACALQVSGRASWGRLAAALHASERTVARRAQRLLDYGTVRVLATVDTQHIGWGDPVLLRLRCEPRATVRVAQTLAQRADTRTVMLTSGSADCFAEVVPANREQLQELLLDTLPGLGVAASHSAYSALRFFAAAHDWNANLLAPGEVARLRGRSLPQLGEWETVESLDDIDRAIVPTLAANGRIPVTVLAARTGISPATASRRIESLIDRGIIRIRAETNPSLFGLKAEALLWMRVRPQYLEAAGLALSTQPAVSSLIAVTGEYQLFAHVLLGGRRALYEFITQTLGGIAGIRDVDVTDALEAVKRGGMTFPTPHAAPRRVMGPRLPQGPGKVGSRSV